MWTYATLKIHNQTQKKTTNKTQKNISKQNCKKK